MRELPATRTVRLYPIESRGPPYCLIPVNAKKSPHFFALEKSGAFHPDKAIQPSSAVPPATNLETNERSESYARIVMRATGEVDFIAGFKAQTNRAKMPFHACARRNRPTDVLCPQVLHRLRRRSQRSSPR